MTLPTRSLDQTLEAAAAEGVDLQRRADLIRARLAEDEAQLDTLRSARGAGPSTRARVPRMHWAPPPALGQLGGHADAPRQRHVWTHLFKDPSGRIPSPLAGVEVGVKDLLAVEGYAVTAATGAHRSVPAEADSPAVAALREAGGRIVGMTNLHALAYGATGLSSDWGVPTNPRVPGAIPGGSSSGSAVAVAEGSADLTLGTDTAGSIRIPAAMCGVVGLKPTYDAVSREGCHPLAPSMDHVGPMARDVRLVSAGFDALTRRTVQGLGEPSSGHLVLGVLGGHFAVLTDEVRTAFDAALAALEGADAHLVEVEPRLATACPGAQLAVQGTEALRSNLAALRERAGQLPEDVRLRLEVGFARTEEQYAAGRELAHHWQIEVDDLLRGCHVLVSPTTVVSAPGPDVTTVRAGEATMSVQSALTRLTVPFNLSGHPAISIPWTDPTGTLIGLQLVGRRGEDRELLHVAAHVERLLGTSG